MTQKNSEMISAHLELQLHGLQGGRGLDGPGASLLCYLGISIIFGKI